MNTLKVSIFFYLEKKCIKFKIELCFLAIEEEQNATNVRTRL